MKLEKSNKPKLHNRFRPDNISKKEYTGYYHDIEDMLYPYDYDVDDLYGRDGMEYFIIVSIGYNELTFHVSDGESYEEVPESELEHHTNFEVQAKAKDKFTEKYPELMV